MEDASCPICWRHYSDEARPVCLPCGHSTCLQCSEAIRSCSLCRQRIHATFRRNTNFALLELVQRTEQARRDATQTNTQYTQTDDTLVARDGRRSSRPAEAWLQNKTVAVQLKRSGIQLSFK